MRIIFLSMLAVALSGCDREPMLQSVGDNDPVSTSAAPSPAAAKSDTLKITYSKSDPFEQPKAAPQTAPTKEHVHDHSGSEKVLPPAKKSEHEEHQKK